MTRLAERVAAVLEREPLTHMSAAARAELEAAVAAADELEDLPGKWQAAILSAEGDSGPPPAGACCHGRAAP